VIVFNPSQLVPTAKESIIMSLVTTAFVASNTELVEQVSYPSVRARILRMHSGYFFLKFDN